jgi:transposase InsO family protein
MMARIEARYLEDTCSDSRRMVAFLARDGIPSSHGLVRDLMRRLGLRAIYHSDQVSQFASSDYVARLRTEEVNITWPSRRRYCDNIQAEG